MNVNWYKHMKISMSLQKLKTEHHTVEGLTCGIDPMKTTRPLEKICVP